MRNRKQFLKIKDCPDDSDLCVIVITDTETPKKTIHVNKRDFREAYKQYFNESA